MYMHINQFGNICCSLEESSGDDNAGVLVGVLLGVLFLLLSLVTITIALLALIRRWVMTSILRLPPPPCKCVLCMYTCMSSVNMQVCVWVCIVYCNWVCTHDALHCLYTGFVYIIRFYGYLLWSLHP